MTKEEKIKYYGKRPLIPIVDTILSSSFDCESSTYLNEGLIKTFPVDRVLNMMSELFDMEIIEGSPKEITRKASQIIMVDELENGLICKVKGAANDDSETIVFYVQEGEYNKELISKHMDKYGYFLSSDSIPYDGVVRLQYEKKFDYDVTDIVKHKKYIYHICPSTIKHKIFQQGITPHTSKWPIFKNDERCYFFLDLNIDLIKRWADNFRNAKKQDCNYLLLAINVEKLSDNIKFYLDPRMTRGVYTLEGIKPDCIEIINENI